MKTFLQGDASGNVVQKMAAFLFWYQFFKSYTCCSCTNCIIAITKQMYLKASQIARFMGPTWDPPGSCRPPDGSHVGPINFTIRDWTSKMLVRYILSSVRLRLSQFFQLSFMEYTGLCVFSLTYDHCENTCTLSYYHHQIGSMSHLSLYRVRSWNNGMHCMSFYILIAIVWFQWSMAVSGEPKLIYH